MPRKRNLSNRLSVTEEVAIDLSSLAEFNPAHVPNEDLELQIELAMSQISVALLGGDFKILSFDQAIANTGYAIVVPDEAEGIRIDTMGLFQTTQLPGHQWEDTLQRSAQLFHFLVDLIREHRPTLILHETPPIGNGPGMHRTDSSIVAATVIRCAAAFTEVPTDMISNNRVKAHLTGNRNAKKKEVRDALKKRFETQLKTPGFRLNEHTYDALGIAITYLDGEST